MPLSAAQKRFLRGLTHHIKAVVTVGDKGLTENVLAEIEQALDHHELIKVKLRADRATRSDLTEEILRRTKAELVHKIGQVSCFYRPNPDRTEVELPRD
ncbi:MAG: ribosome assembly RNA-binding protein YhbY [Xanthomonadales bacterium]|nr:ribosome assembly RNA-binding protein YhbY [Xanthomonadales bacterium]NIX13330.1 ribosome assembly RNA-binding protein YhbY [Xanthomonadales bacterium]